MKELSLKEMQDIELGILKIFDGVCKKHNLRYCIDGGTLLGANCYEGFIPWDDDIDLKMPREDYEKLLTLKEEFPDYIEIEVPTRKKCEYLLTKIIDNRTVLIEDCDGLEKTTGVYVDLFPMDGHPQDEREAERHYKKLSKYNTLFHNSLDGFSSLKKSKSFVSRIKGAIYSVIYSPYGLCKKINRIAKKYKYDECEKKGLLIEGDSFKERFEKGWLEPFTDLTFEGESLPAPKEYRLHLARFYGEQVLKEEYRHNLPYIPPAHSHKVYKKD